MDIMQSIRFLGDWPKVILQTQKAIAANHLQTGFASNPPI
jgi:hypothetical protein